MTSTLGFQPLYQQVYDLLVKRLSNSDYLPGEMLPSEQVLAKELSVSQGTVRKSLDRMTAEKLLERRQGKGTFVSEQTQEMTTFRFFKLARVGGERLTPHPREEKIRKRMATLTEQKKLDSMDSNKVYEISRIRMIDNKQRILEKIVVSADVFTNLTDHAPLPNALYTLYQNKFGINVISTNEEISATVAKKMDAKRLGVQIGDPLLNIDRTTIGLDGRCVELRTTRMSSKDIVYSVKLT